MREQGFPILSLFGLPGGIIVFFVGFYLLDLGLTSYVIFWCISFGTDFICMFFLLFFLPESMPDSLKKPLEVRKQGTFPCPLFDAKHDHFYQDRLGTNTGE